MSEAMTAIRETMVQLVRDPGRRPRERVAAARVLLSAERLVRESDRLRSVLRAPGPAPVPDDAPDSVVQIGGVS